MLCNHTDLHPPTQPKKTSVRHPPPLIPPPSPAPLQPRRLNRVLAPDTVVTTAPTGSPSHGEDVAVYAFDINQPSLPSPWYSVLVSISVCMTLSTVFHSVKSPDNSPLSHAVLPVLFLPYRSFQLHSSL